MRKTMIMVLSMLGVLFVLLAALIAVVRFYPYTYGFSAYPKITQTKSGAAGDPINLLFVGTKEQLTHGFHQAGWLTPDPITPQTSARIAEDSLAHRSYPTAPVSNLYVFGRVQDLAFEKPTTDVQYRGHIRIWKTTTLIDGQPVWIGAATYDSGIELSGANHLPTHHIASTVDLERNAVGSDLAKTGLVKEEANAAFTVPMLFARNGGGDYYESDGNILVIEYMQTSFPLPQAVWGMDGLKTGMFLCYDVLLTVGGSLTAFLVLVGIIVVGLILWRLVERNPSLKQTGLIMLKGYAPPGLLPPEKLVEANGDHATDLAKLRIPPSLRNETAIHGNSEKKSGVRGKLCSPSSLEKNSERKLNMQGIETSSR